MKSLKDIIQEGVLDISNIDSMDNDVLTVELSSDLMCHNKARFDKAVFKLYELLSKGEKRIKSKNNLELDEYYIKFPPGLSDRYGHAIMIFKHCKTDDKIVSKAGIDAVDYMFYRANGTSPWKFDYNDCTVKANFRDNTIYKCPDNLKPVMQAIMNDVNPFRGQLKF